MTANYMDIKYCVVEKYMCLRCDYETPDSGEFLQHVLNAHKDEDFNQVQVLNTSLEEALKGDNE